MKPLEIIALLAAAGGALMGWVAWRLSRSAMRAPDTGARIVLILCAVASGGAAILCGLASPFAGSRANMRQ